MNRKFLLLIPALTLLGLAAALPAQTRPDGATLFRQRCASCHNMTPGARAVLAPSLVGVLNRKAGSTVFNYSPALKASNVVWNRANLDRYVSAPGRMVPGTRMVISVSDAAQRTAILDFIARAPSR
jgi:cytochrome c